MMRHWLFPVLLLLSTGLLLACTPLPQEYNHLFQYVYTGLNGLEHTPGSNLPLAVSSVVQRLYTNVTLPRQPITYKHVNKSQRNRLIRQRYEAGETLQEIADAFGVSVQRIHQILTQCD